MKYLEYKEHRQHGTFNFPIAYYHQIPTSPRYHMPYHWHHEFEIIHIISGAFNLTLDGNSKVYHEGDVVFVTDGTLHGGNPVDNSCVYDCIVFDLQIMMKENNICSKTIQDITKHKLSINSLLTKNSKAVSEIVDQLTASLCSKNEGYEFMAQGYMYQLFGIIMNEHLYTESHVDEISAQRLDSIKNVFSYISDNYSNNISLDDLAKIAGMNPKYLCRYFRGMTERTPIDYLNYYRIECACEMLATKDYSIKEVAISCGFNDESYFIKTFHKYKQITPKQFMKAEFN